MDEFHLGEIIAPFAKQSRREVANLLNTLSESEGNELPRRFEVFRLYAFVGMLVNCPGISFHRDHLEIFSARPQCASEPANYLKPVPLVQTFCSGLGLLGLLAVSVPQTAWGGCSALVVSDVTVVNSL